jgi:predicted metal-dependent HD superfamily phosphohydrolase
MMAKTLEQRWFDLWRRVAEGWHPLGAYQDLVRRYAEPDRHYHTLKHIEHCLNELARVRHLAKWPDAIEIALWYHDVVYNTKAHDNEDHSAVQAAVVLQSAHVSPRMISKVRQLILATKHTAPSEDPDTQLLLDIDLSILGQEQAVFDRYEQAIRREYSWVPDDMFTQRRAELLRGFQSRGRIYRTEFFFEAYERQAHQNLSHSLSKLSQHS